MPIPRHGNQAMFTYFQEVRISVIEERYEEALACRRLLPVLATPPLIAISPAPRCAASVVIPARDEEGAIEGTLRALGEQRDLGGEPLAPDTYEVILLANNCRDDTAAVARSWAERNAAFALHVVELDLPPGTAHVGTARRIAMNEASRRLFSLDRPRGIIATTDADTLVAPTWIAETRREVALGAEAVGGRILVAARERRAMALRVRNRFLRNVGYHALANEVLARIDPRPADPWPWHEQFFGASLAITARAYRAVGGLPALPSGEDAALAEALRRANIEIRHSPAVRVHTSGRLDGRAPAGLAALLASWSGLTTDDQYQRVPSAADVVVRATSLRAARDLWQSARMSRDVCSGELAVLADHAGVPEAWLGQAILNSACIGLLLSEIDARAFWRRTPELVDVRVGIDQLRSWLEPYRRPGAPPPTFARHLADRPFLELSRRFGRLAVRERRRPMLSSLEQVQPEAEIATALAPSTHVA
jgi:hypothetical protein